MKKVMLTLALIASLACSCANAGILQKIGFKNCALITSITASFPYLFSNKKGFENKVKDGNSFWKQQGNNLFALLRKNATTTCDWIKERIK